LPTCLGSRSTQVRILPLRQWVAIWDRAGLQNRPARFNPSAARRGTIAWGSASLLARARRGRFQEPSEGSCSSGECPSRWGTGPENQGDLRVRGSIPPLSSNVETRCLSVRHTGPLRRRAHTLREFDSLRLLRVGQSRVSGGEPMSGTACSLVEVAKTVKAAGCNPVHAGSIPALDSHGLLAPEVFQAARWLARSEERVRLPLGAHDARVADRHEAPAFQAGEAGSIPAACSRWFLQGGCWHPSRPHKPAPVGSIPTPATGATSWCCSSKSVSQGANVSKSTGLISREAVERDEGNNLSISIRAKRAGRPRVARLQVGGRLVGRPPCTASQA
jgi:hypothetical protein